MSVVAAIRPSRTVRFAPLTAGRHDFTITINDWNGTPQTHYWSLIVPVGYSPSRPWPAMVGFHGSGERFTGANSYAPVTGSNVGLGSWAVANLSTIRCLCVVPQTYNPVGFTQAIADYEHSVFNLCLAAAKAIANIDNSRVYPVGLSDQGHRIWWHLINEPTKWASGILWSTSLSGKEVTNTIDAGTPATDAAGDTLAVSVLAAKPFKVIHHTDDVTVDPARDYATSLAFGGPSGAPRTWNDGIHFFDLDSTGGHDTWTAWLGTDANLQALELIRL